MSYLIDGLLGQASEGVYRSLLVLLFEAEVDIGDSIALSWCFFLKVVNRKGAGCSSYVSCRLACFYKLAARSYLKNVFPAPAVNPYQSLLIRDLYRGTLDP